MEVFIAYQRQRTQKSLQSATLRFSDTQAADCHTCMAGGRAPRRASSSSWMAQIRRLPSSTLRTRSNACFLSLTPHASDGHAGATEGVPVLLEPDLHKQHESRSSQLMNLEVTNSYCKSTREDIPLVEHSPRVDPARTNHLRPQDHWHAYMQRRRQLCHNRSVFPSNFKIKRRHVKLNDSEKHRSLARRWLEKNELGRILWFSCILCLQI